MNNMYAIKESTLTALGDAVREKSGKLTRPLEYTIARYTLSGFGNNSMPLNYFPRYLGQMVAFNKVKIKLVDLEGVSKVEVWNTYSGLCSLDENNELIAEGSLSNDLTLRFDPKDASGVFKGIIEITAYLDDEPVVLADEVITNTMTPLQMAEEINNIPPTPTAEELTITGNCSYKFAFGGWDWFIEKYGNLITTKDITDAQYMFYNSEASHVPFDLNFYGDDDTNANNMFYGCGLETVPRINNFKVGNRNNLFQSSYYLKEIPQDWCDTWDWSAVDSETTQYGAGQSASMFNGCNTLRSFPMVLLEHANAQCSYSYVVYKDTFYNCYSLDEIVGMPNPHNKAKYSGTSYSAFISANFVNKCYRLKRFTFADGIIAQWDKQVLDLSQYVGWVASESDVRDTWMPVDHPGPYDRLGIADKKVTDADTYAALKDDPDWWTMDVAYSRYNHDSAVETINSLPDTTASGANTIKFKGAAGSATDGGAINTLTEEEIAVATARGWTVTFA